MVGYLPGTNLIAIATTTSSSKNLRNNNDPLSHFVTVRCTVLYLNHARTLRCYYNVTLLQKGLMYVVSAAG